MVLPVMYQSSKQANMGTAYPGVMADPLKEYP